MNKENEKMSYEDMQKQYEALGEIMESISAAKSEGLFKPVCGSEHSDEEEHNWICLTRSVSSLSEMGGDNHQTEEWLKRNGGTGYNGKFGEIGQQSAIGGYVLTPDKVEGYTVMVQEECHICGVERFTHFILNETEVKNSDRFESIREYVGEEE